MQRPAIKENFMRKVVVAEFVSLDGVIHEPIWTFHYWYDEIAAFKHNELFSSDALLLGRVTYEGFAQAWPGQTDKQGYADRMNGLPKYVVSTTLKKAEWNNSHLVKANVVDEISKLKQQDGQNILIFGSGKLIETLIQHDLVDQYNLLIYPLVVGSGQRMFEEGTNTRLKLADTRTFSSGVVALIYEPVPHD
jgi:dihydrofolate reductase